MSTAKPLLSSSLTDKLSIKNLMILNQSKNILPNYNQNVKVITILHEIFTKTLGVIITTIALIIIIKGINLKLPEKYQSFFETWSFNPDYNPHGNIVVVYCNLFLLVIITVLGLCMALH